MSLRLAKGREMRCSPSLSGLSINAGAARTDPDSDDATALNVPHIPDELWAKILKAMDHRDPCQWIQDFCRLSRATAALCEEGSGFFDAINKAFGWYGQYRTLDEARAAYVPPQQPTEMPWYDGLEYAITGYPARRLTEPPQLEAIPPDAFVSGKAWFKHVCMATWKYSLQTIDWKHPAYTFLATRALQKPQPAKTLAFLYVHKDARELKKIFDKTFPTLDRNMGERIDYRDPRYDTLVKLALNRHPKDIRFLGPDDPNDEQYATYAEYACRVSGMALEYVDHNHTAFNRLVRVALAEDGLALQFVPPGHPNYYELAEIAIEQSPMAIAHVQMDRVSERNYVTLAQRAMSKNGRALVRITDKRRELGDGVFETIARVAVEQNGRVLELFRRRGELTEMGQRLEPFAKEPPPPPITPDDTVDPVPPFAEWKRIYDSEASVREEAIEKRVLAEREGQRGGDTEAESPLTQEAPSFRHGHWIISNLLELKEMYDSVKATEEGLQEINEALQLHGSYLPNDWDTEWNREGIPEDWLDYPPPPVKTSWSREEFEEDESWIGLDVDDDLSDERIAHIEAFRDVTQRANLEALVTVNTAVYAWEEDIVHPWVKRFREMDAEDYERSTRRVLESIYRARAYKALAAESDSDDVESNEEDA